MKIFDWMHRTFNAGAKYSQVSQIRDDEEKREVSFEGMMERESLLLHDVLNGILTIGTLGHEDCLMPQPYDTELEEDDGGEHVEAEDALAVPVAAAVESTPAVVIKESFTFKLAAEGEQKKAADDDVGEGERVLELPLLKEDRERRERGRTTLADLFAADSFEPANGAVGIDGSKRGGDAGSVEKRWKKKKGITKNKEEEKQTSERTKSSTSAANRKLQKLVTKMMMKKKKIHPEIAAAAQKTAVAAYQAAEMPKPTCDRARTTPTSFRQD